MVTITSSETALKNGLCVPVAALVSGGDLLVRERERPVVSSGFRPLDGLLPAGGVRPGSLIEWLADGDTVATGGGAATLACAVACRLAAAGPSGGAGGDQARPRTIVVVDRAGWFHPPAVLPWLGDERRLVVARPSRDDDEIWAIDQALRCTGVAAVLAWPRANLRRPNVRSGSRLAGSLQQWATAMRRWQLAAAASGAVGLFVRPRATLGEPSWAEARIAVSPLSGGLRQTGGLRQAGGTLMERQLRLTLLGGGWSASAPDARRTVEVALDLTRGVAGVSRTGLGAALPAAPRSVAKPEAGGWAGERSGAACRAS